MEVDDVVDDIRDDFCLNGLVRLPKPFLRQIQEETLHHRASQQLGMEAIYGKPKTSKRHPAHKVYPLLLRGLQICR